MAVAAQTNVEKQLLRAQIEGWRYNGSMATEGEVLELLCALIQVEKPEVVVETGTFAGHGTRAIQEGLQLNAKGHLWTVECDPELCEQYAEMELDQVTFVCADSVEWAGDPTCSLPIDFAFVDCAEDPSGRVEVFARLLPKIRAGGVICAHDTDFYRYDDYLKRLVEIAGPYSLHIPALNGFTIWRVKDE